MTIPDENDSRVPLGGHAEYRYRGLLTTRPAVGDEKIACPVEYRVVDLVQSSRPAGANRDIGGFERARPELSSPRGPLPGPPE